MITYPLNIKVGGFQLHVEIPENAIEARKYIQTVVSRDIEHAFRLAFPLTFPDKTDIKVKP